MAYTAQWVTRVGRIPADSCHSSFVLRPTSTRVGSAFADLFVAWTLLLFVNEILDGSPCAGNHC
eukprot:SAG31_NODE_27193_length_430_cov_0.625378_1_plen_63_part_10